MGKMEPINLSEHLQLALERLWQLKEEATIDEDFVRATQYRDAGDAVKRALLLLEQAGGTRQ